MASLRGDSKIVDGAGCVMAVPFLVCGLSQPGLDGCEESSLNMHRLTT